MGYSLGGVTARLTTARYQGDPAWRLDLGVQPQLPAKLIAFGDAPLEGANIPYALQHSLWTELSPNGRPFPYSQLPQTMARSNLNSCGAQQLLRKSYPTVTQNFARFWEHGEDVRFPNIGNPFGVCDRIEGGDCVCDAGPDVFGVNGGGWATGIRMVAFSDGYPGPQACYGDNRDLGFGGKSVCADLLRAFPGATYPFELPNGNPVFLRIAVPFGFDKDLLATVDEIAAGSRLSNVTKVECVAGSCGGIKYQYFGPTFIPFDSALPPSAPFGAAWYAPGYQGVHGVGIPQNIDRLLQEMEAVNADVPAVAGVSVRPADLATGSTPVTVTFPNVLVEGKTTLTLSHQGPAPFPQSVPGDPPLYYEIQSTVTTAATVNDPIEVCIDYSGVRFMDEDRIALFHYEAVGWADITSFRDPEANRICGNTTSLSPLALFEPVNRAPVVTAGRGVTAEAQGPQGALVNLTTAGSYDPDRDRVSYEWLDAAGAVLAIGGLAEIELAIGLHELTLRGRDSRWAEGSAALTVTVADTTPPTVSLTVSGGRQRTLSAEATDLVGVVAVELEVDGALIGTLWAPPFVLAWDTTSVSDGRHTLQAKARDAAGNVGLSAPVEVLVDNTPPELSVTAAPQVVWPPNQKFVTITVGLTVHDAIDPQPTVGLESIICDDGCVVASDVAGADFGTDDRTFLLRAKRSGTGAGRTYIVTYAASDASGNTRRATTAVFVPHDQGRQW